MNSQEKTGKETQGADFEKKGAERQCGCSEAIADTGCCGMGVGEGNAQGMAGMMEKCSKGMKKTCRWFPLIPVVLGGAGLLLGYYLNPEAVRVLWLLVSGAVVLMGLLGIILMGAVLRA